MIKNTNSKFNEETGIRLSSVSQLRLFNILKDWDETKFLNIWRAYDLNTEGLERMSMFIHHKVDDNDWWDSISKTYYGSENLWWVIALFNEVNNPFEELEAGKTINILKENYLYTLMKEIRSINLLGN